eukprot:COSAG06_NODE_1355_length_9743_cov_3.335061_10_plen_62_part_00
MDGNATTLRSQVYACTSGDWTYRVSVYCARVLPEQLRMEEAKKRDHRILGTKQVSHTRLPQ